MIHRNGENGLRVSMNTSPLHYFNLFMKDTEFELIATKINQYFDQVSLLKQPKVHACMNS